MWDSKQGEKEGGKRQLPSKSKTIKQLDQLYKNKAFTT